ncbi:ABC transporter substrate-binding protein [Nakamurella sp. A5-74]|uniref:ABC transporter substrate-binding protein n=1 Tax=Nakamurella sp. A5-74 TaxID=3158264 RepID=A0AAU8DLA0_9ACTN
MKRIPLVSALAAALLLVAACGDSGSSSTTNTPTAPATSSAAPSTSAGGSSPGASSTGASSDGESSSAGTSESSAPSSSGSGGSSSAALPTEPGSIVIGSAAFPENVLLAEIYGGAMAAKGVTVTKKLSIGERGIYLTALKNGEIGFVPEYSGSILSNLDPSAKAKSPKDVDAALKTVAAAQGFGTTNSAEAQNADTITVTQETADKYKLTSIEDLKAVAGELTLGAPAQFQTRPDGVPALESVYGVKFGTFTPTESGGTITVDALKGGSIDAADIFSTDPSITANGFVVLTDPKSMFAAQSIVPLFSQKVLTQPMADAADAVSAKLDTKTLAGLDAKLSGDNAAQIAQEWLKSENLG